MRRYNIRIDGEVMPNSYSYEELLLNDILDFDDIEIKQVSKSNWTNIKSFYFPEEHEDETESEFTVDENGQAHFNHPPKKKEQKEYSIDEFGQVVSQNNIGGGASGTSSGSSSSSSSSDDGVGWKIVGTIIVIGIAIALCAGGVIGATVAVIGGFYACRQIWND